MKYHRLILLLLLLVVGVCVSSPVMAFNLNSIKPDELDYTLQYTHFSKNRLVVNGYSFYDFLIIGLLEVKEVDNDLMQGLVTARYHLSPERNIDIKIPVKYNRQKIISYTDKEHEEVSVKQLDRLGIGDIEFVFSDQDILENGYQVNFLSLKTATGNNPYDLNEDQLPLGTGHIGLKLGLNRMFRLDPVMLFGGANYCINFPRNVEEYGGLIDPGDTFQYSLGIAYAINQKISVSTRLEQSFVGATKIEDEKQADSDAVVANLYIDLNYLTDNNLNYQYSVGIGLTEDSPDFNFSISRSIAF